MMSARDSEDGRRGRREVNCACLRQAKRIASAGGALYVCPSNVCGFCEPASPRQAGFEDCKGLDATPEASPGRREPDASTYQIHVFACPGYSATTILLTRDSGWLKVRFVPVSVTMVALLRQIAHEHRRWCSDRRAWLMKDDEQAILAFLKVLRESRQAGGSRFGQWIKLTPYDQWKELFRDRFGGVGALLALTAGIDQPMRRNNTMGSRNPNEVTAQAPFRQQPDPFVNLVTPSPDADERLRQRYASRVTGARRLFVEQQQAAIDSANDQRKRKRAEGKARGLGRDDDDEVEVCDAITVTQAAERAVQEAEANGELLIID